MHRVSVEQQLLAVLLAIRIWEGLFPEKDPGEGKSNASVPEG